MTRVLSEAFCERFGEDPLDLREVGSVGATQLRVLPEDAESPEPCILALAEVVELLVDRRRIPGEHLPKGLERRLSQGPSEQVGPQLLDAIGVGPDDG